MDYTPGKEYDTIRGQRVLVTGGLGVCGSNLTRFLAERLDCRVTVIDDLSNSTLPDRTLRNVEVVVADVRDLAAYQSHLETNPWIFHLDCRTILTCSADPEGDLSVNATGTLRLLEWLRHQAPPKFQRFL